MKQFKKYFLIMLTSLLFFSAPLMAQSKWAPIMMGDITTFVPYIVENNPQPPVKPIQTVQNTYNPNETVSVNVQMALSGDQDWVGIFRKNDDNSWSNVLAWNWVISNGVVSLTRDQDPLPAGEYEIRLFFHNEYGAGVTARASYGFSVSANNYVYGSPGDFMNEVDIDNSNPDFVIYKPRNHITDAPVMLYFGMSYAIGNRDANNNKISLRSEGIMKYLASLGCYVIGNKISTGGWTDATKWPDYTQELVKAKNNGANTDKLGIIGHSAGGMAAYYWMKRYKDAGYGESKSFIIDLHGYYAASMNEANLNSLTDVDSLIIAYGGYNGDASESTHTDNPNFTENPRVLLTLSHLLPNTIQKAFIVIDTKDHMYSYGEWETTTINGDTYDAIKTKTKLLEPIDAMIKYEFFNEVDQYENAKNILFDGYGETIQKVDEETQNFLDNGGAYRFDCDKWMGIDYCSDYR